MVFGMIFDAPLLFSWALRQTRTRTRFRQIDQMNMPEIEFWAWVFHINTRLWAKDRRNLGMNRDFDLQSYEFFCMKFNNFIEIAHNWVLWLEFLNVFCLSLSFLLEFWVFLGLSFFQRADANDTCPANDARMLNTDDTNDLSSLFLPNHDNDQNEDDLREIAMQIIMNK